MEFGATLKALRKYHRLTQKELAAVVGKTNSAIYDWENGRSYPSLEELVKIADYFNVSTDYLLGRIKLRQPLENLRDDIEKSGDNISTVTLFKRYTKKNMELLNHIIDAFFDESNESSSGIIKEIFDTVGYRIDKER